MTKIPQSGESLSSGADDRRECRTGQGRDREWTDHDWVRDMDRDKLVETGIWVLDETKQWPRSVAAIRLLIRERDRLRNLADELAQAIAVSQAALRRWRQERAKSCTCALGDLPANIHDVHEPDCPGGRQ